MNVKFLGKSGATTLVHGKVYHVTGVEKGWYRIVDEDEDDDDSESIPGYLYPPDQFEVINDDEK